MADLRGNQVSNRRAELVVQFACELLGLQAVPEVEALVLPLSVAEFQQQLQHRYANVFPRLVMRSEATIERARLTRSDVPLRLPRVVLRQGAPPASARH
jgi:hypothetical protein